MSDESLQGRRQLAQILRELAYEVTTADIDDSSFLPIAKVLATERDRLAQRPRLAREVDGLLIDDKIAELYGRVPAFDRDPLIGSSNPVAPPLVRVEGGDPNEWTVTFGAAYEGHPGFVHGGFVAAAIDHVLGVTAASDGAAAMTGTLTIRYLRPTPTDTRLRCIGEIDRTEGRKVFCRGTLEAQGTTFAEGDGIFLLVEPDRY